MFIILWDSSNQWHYFEAAFSKMELHMFWNHIEVDSGIAQSLEALGLELR